MPFSTAFFLNEMEWIRQFYCSLEPIMLYCMEDLLGGPKPFKVRSAVNLQVRCALHWTVSNNPIEGRNLRVCAAVDDLLPQRLPAVASIHIRLYYYRSVR